MFIPTSNCKLLLWLLSFTFLYSINTITTLAQPDFLSYFCENTANYTVNSPYQRNLNTTLSILPTTNNGFGFFNRSTGQGIDDTVNSVALCRGDVNPDVCQTCLNESIVKLRQLCPNQKEGVGYYDYCMLKYSNEDILGSTRIKFYVLMLNTQNATGAAQFMYALAPLMFQLRFNASKGGPLLKYASGNTTVPDLSRDIYASVQCTPDLSEQQCLSCLQDLDKQIPQRFDWKVGGRILVPMCNFRYERYQFFNPSAQPYPQPSPSIPPQPPQPEITSFVQHFGETLQAWSLTLMVINLLS